MATFQLAVRLIGWDLTGVIIARVHASLSGTFCLALVTLLGAGPATQPVDAPPTLAVARAHLQSLRQTVTNFEEFPVRSNTRGGMLVAPERKVDPQIRVAPRYVTPQREWIPRQFNGMTYFLIPCDGARSVAAVPGERAMESVGGAAPAVAIPAMPTVRSPGVWDKYFAPATPAPAAPAK